MSDYKQFNNLIEDNWSIYNDNGYMYKLDDNGNYISPIKSGVSFPFEFTKELANKTLTNKALYNTKYANIFGSFLNTLPGLNGNNYDVQIRDICANIPYFKKIVDSYISIIVSNGVIIDIEGNEQAEKVINNNDIVALTIQLIKDYFMQGTSCVLVNKNNNVNINALDIKNFMIMKDALDFNYIHSYVVYNVVYNKNIIEIVEYINGDANHLINDKVIKVEKGNVIKYIYEYNDGTIGKLLNYSIDYCYKTSDGYIKECPVVSIAYNKDEMTDNYGNDLFSTFDSVALAPIMAFNNILKLCNRVCDITKIVPQSSIVKASYGIVNLNLGAVTYDDNIPKDIRPEISYVIPPLKEQIEGALEAFNKAASTLAASTSTSSILFDSEKIVGSRVSGETLKVLMSQTILQSKMITEQIKGLIVDTIKRVLLYNGINIDKANISITLNDSPFDDNKDKIEYVNARLDNGTFDKVDAIKYLDKVSKSKALLQLRSMNNYTTLSENGSNNNIVVDKTNINYEASDKNDKTAEAKERDNSGVILDKQLPFGIPNVDIRVDK